MLFISSRKSLICNRDYRRQSLGLQLKETLVNPWVLRFVSELQTQTTQPPPVTGVIETALYVDDLQRAVAFYRKLFGFPILNEDNRFCALDVARRSVLLLFLRGASTEPIRLPFGVIPPHDSQGPAHFAFAIPAGSVDAWEAYLRKLGVIIESSVFWPSGGRSLYFRDPDGHAVELATPGTWATY